METSEFQTVCRVGEIPEGEGKAVQVGNKIVAVFNVKGQYHAIDDVCPHMGASLSSGYQEDGIVTCPWHGFQFDVTSGQHQASRSLVHPTFPVKVDGEGVWIDLTPDRRPSTSDLRPPTPGH